MKSYLWPTLAVVTVLALGCADSPANITEHPLADYVARRTVGGSLIQEGAWGAAPSFSRRWEMTIPDYLGRVGDRPAGVVDPDGITTVINSRSNEMFRLGRNGEPLDHSSLPRETRLSGAAVAALGLDSLAAITPGDRVVLFRKTGQTYEVADLLATIPGAGGLCGMRTELFVNSRLPNGLVRQWSADGVLKSSFGYGYPHGDERLQRRLSSAAIGCIPEDNAVMLAYEHMPIIELLAVGVDEPRRLWTRADHAGIRIETEGRTIRYNRSMPHDIPVAVVGMGNGQILVQYSRVGDPNPVTGRRSMKVINYLLNTMNGSAVRVDLDGERSVAIAGRDGSVVAVRGMPSEAIVMMQVQRSSGR